MAQLRIAMLTTFYPPYSFGGDALGVQRLASALARRGHHVVVVHDVDAYMTLAGREPEPSPSDGAVEVIPLRSRAGLVSNLLTHQTGHPVVHRKRLRRLLEPGAFDIVWFHNISLIGGPGVLSFGDGLKIYEAHEHWLVCPTHVLWRYNQEVCDARRCLRCAISYWRPPQLWRYLGGVERQFDHVDAFIAKSEFSRQKHKEFGFSRGMEVIPYFLPNHAAAPEAPESPPHNRPYFLFVGRLEQLKGLDEVIPLFADYPDADLIIIGTGTHEATLRRQAADIDTVHFLGRLDPDDVSRYYRSAIALVVPSVGFETFGVILIEAFREGTPVIARDIGPFGEIVNRCNGGILFSNTDELRQAMRRLQERPDERRDMGASARAGFERWWSEAAVLQTYTRTLQRIALEKGRHHVAESLEA